MKTYSEEEGREPFDWNKFLDKDEFTLDELKDACSRAGSWVTCAVGNQCSVIPRDEIGEPIDMDLFNLGLKFHYSILNMHESNENHGIVYGIYIEEAREVLDKIEKRSAELIEEYNK